MSALCAWLRWVAARSCIKLSKSARMFCRAALWWPKRTWFTGPTTGLTKSTLSTERFAWFTLSEAHQSTRGRGQLKGPRKDWCAPACPQVKGQQGFAFCPLKLISVKSATSSNKSSQPSSSELRLRWVYVGFCARSVTCRTASMIKSCTNSSTNSPTPESTLTSTRPLEILFISNKSQLGLRRELGELRRLGRKKLAEVVVSIWRELVPKGWLIWLKFEEEAWCPLEGCCCAERAVGVRLASSNDSSWIGALPSFLQASAQRLGPKNACCALNTEDAIDQRKAFVMLNLK